MEYFVVDHIGIRSNAPDDDFGNAGRKISLEEENELLVNPCILALDNEFVGSDAIKSSSYVAQVKSDVYLR